MGIPSDAARCCIRNISPRDALLSDGVIRSRYFVPSRAVTQNFRSQDQPLLIGSPVTISSINIVFSCFHTQMGITIVPRKVQGWHESCLVISAAVSTCAVLGNISTGVSSCGW